MGLPFDTDPAGWYDDPAGRGQPRYWSGTGWTSWVWDGTEVAVDPLPDRPFTPPRTDRAHLAYVRDVFLPRARAAGVVAPLAIAALTDYARNLDPQVETRTPVPAGASRSVQRPSAAEPPPTATTAPVATGSTGSTGSGLSTGPRGPGPSAALEPSVPRPHEPGPVARWWDRTKETVGSDLAAHGLAYLGVLLLFVGVFGLVAFAFGDVAPTARPVAELGIAVAPFLAAWMLLRRGAAIAGRALETAGGLLLPVMLITSFVDGVEVPPDATGPSLVVALSSVTAAVAAAYAVWSVRHPKSTLRYLVAPIGWLAVALATMGAGREIPSGKGVATVTAAQVAAVGLAVLVSLVWAWMRPHSLFAGPTFTSTVPGLVILAPLAVLTWAVGGWPEVPIAITGVTGLLVLELMIGRLRRSVVTAIQPLWWACVALALVPSLGLPAAGAIAAAGFVALLELEHFDGSSMLPTALSVTGLGVSVLCLWSQPLWAFTVLVALTCWAHVRRLTPYAIPGAAPALDLAAGVFPMAAVVALGLATRHAPAAVLVGAVLALLTAWPATRRGDHRLLRRAAGDHFWVLWWDTVMVVTTLAIALMAAAAWPTVGSARWMLVSACALLAVSSAVGPLPRMLRPWIVLALVTWTWVLAASVTGLATATVAVVVSLGALVVVVWSHLLPHPLARWVDAGSGALAGLALGLLAVLPTTSARGWGLALAVTLATASWLVTAACTELGRSPATDLAVRVSGPGWRYAPAVVAAVGVPATVALILDASGLLTLASPWAPIVVSATAVGYAATARALRPGVARTVIVWACCVAAVAAPLLTTEQRPALVALLALVAATVVLPRDRRPIPMVWLSWATVAPLSGLVVLTATTVLAGRTTELAVAVTTLTVGSALLLAAAALDILGRGWVPVRWPTHPTLVPLAVLGAAEVAASLAVATTSIPAGTAGWVTALVAVVVVAVAVLTRAWSLVGVAAALGWMSALKLRGDDVLHAASLGVLVTVLLAGAVALAHRLVHDTRLWVRADWTLAFVAHLTALTALVAAGTGDSFSRTCAAVGLIGVAVAVRVRRIPAAAGTYGVLGAALVLVGAAAAGPGLLALALACLSLACSFVAAQTSGVVRWTLIVTGSVAAFAAWLSLTSWLEWSSRQTVDRTVLLGAAVSLGCASLLRWARADRTVVLVRGALAVAATTLTPFLPNLTVSDTALVVTSSTCLAVALLAVSLAVAARPLAVDWVRYAALAYAALAGMQLSDLLGWTATGQLLALSATTVACCVALLLPGGRGLWESWRRPVTVPGSGTALAGVGLSLAQLPGTGLLVGALLVAALMSGTLAVETRSLLAQVGSSVLVCAAWVVFATQALDRNPQWFLVPVGLTVLVIVGLLRNRLRTTGSDPAAVEVVALEWTGIGCIVAPSLVQAVTVGLGYAVLAVVLGLLIVGWGLLTQVRRRVTAGGVDCLAALLVLVGVPLSQLLPAWSGATLWVTIACVGLLAIVGATLLEKGRAVVRGGLVSFRAMTDGWE